MSRRTQISSIGFTSVCTRWGLLLASMLFLLPVPVVMGQITFEDYQLLANDGRPRDEFGYSVAVDNGVIAVGAWHSNNAAGRESGSVYLFDASDGTQLMRIVPLDGTVFGHFGAGVAIDNGLLVVSAPGVDTEGLYGAIYIFDITTGTQISRIIPDHATSHQFGATVDIDNGIVVIGARWEGPAGAAFLYDAVTGSFLAKLVPDDPIDIRWFGSSVGISNGTIVIGTYLSDLNGKRDSGAAYLFDATTYTQRALLIPNDFHQFDHFGWDVAIDNGIAVVGSPLDDDNGFNSGSVYLFDATSGIQLTKIISQDGFMNQRFGTSIAIKNGILIVGALFSSETAQSGAAYEYQVPSGIQIAKLLPSNPDIAALFGESTALDRDIVVIGASRDSTTRNQAGAAYGYKISCAADLNHDGLANSQDFLLFLNAWSANDPLADWNADGTIDTQDFLAYLNDWTTGCP